MPRPRAWRLFMIAASFVFYADWDWKFVFLLAVSILWNQAIGGRDLPDGGAVDAQGARPARRRRRPRPARLLQVLRLLRQLAPQPGAATSGSGSRSASRSIVLPVGISFFTFMAISYIVDIYRREFEPVSLAEVRRLPLVLPAPRRRADRARFRADPAAGDAAATRAASTRPRLLPDRDRPVQEGRDRELPRDAHRRPGLRRAGQPLVARDPGRGLRLRRPDLRRLLGLHGHGDRPRAAARLQASRRTSTARTRRSRSRTSGGAGT